MPSQDLRDLIDALTKTPETLAGLVKDLSDPDLRAKNYPGEFSIVESVCHLRDIEIDGYTARFSRILTENNPLLPDIDGSRLAAECDYQSQNFSEALQAFAAARNQNTQRLSRLAAEQFDREGVLEGVGTVTIRGLLLMMRDHDAEHLIQISSIQRRPNVAS